MTALTRVTPQRLAEIRRRNEALDDFISAGLMHSTIDSQDRADLLAEVDRLAATVRHTTSAMTKVGLAMQTVIATAMLHGDKAGMRALTDFVADAELFPDPQDGGA